jgi:hypothetical protein
MDHDLAATRRSLHAVAELLLAGPSHRAVGTIRLEVAPHGFATHELAGDPRRLRVRGLDLVVEHASGPDAVVPLRGTFAEVAANAGITAGRADGVYSDTSGLDVDDAIEVDADHALTIYDWFGAGDAALRRFSAGIAGTAPVLWPEHFDVAITVDEVNYGVSAGDDSIDRPYAYVGPWTSRTGAFWNAPFGAVRTIDELGDADLSEVLEFFDQGRAALDA